ncbi:MAG: 4Fe-4S dicluster domain-containing protein [Erysipelotrichaceae bacterium]|nr:4Fe-4S dicluster domain-containing protein [Erysipelotrichaceae bacterium]
MIKKTLLISFRPLYLFRFCKGVFMTRYGFIYDQAKCIGCNVCQMACKDKNNLEMGLFFRRAETLEIPAGEQPQFFHFSGACIHCDDAECIAHCPTGAMYRRADGTVGHRKEKCIGCGICTKVCPQAAPKLSVRDGRSSKCDGCFDLRRQGKNPACVDACLTHCLKLVDYDTLDEYRERKAEYPWE